MDLEIYSHNYGQQAIPPVMLKKMKNAINSIKFNYQRNSASVLRKLILDELHMLGWSDKTRIDVDTKITVTAMKEQIALCLQTGNMSRMYADLIKLQYLYQKDRAEAAFYLLPTKDTAKEMGSNMANLERLVTELKLYKHIISIPIVVIGFC